MDRCDIVGYHHFCGLSIPEINTVRVFIGEGRVLRGMNVQLRRMGGCRFRGTNNCSIFKSIMDCLMNDRMAGVRGVA